MTGFYRLSQICKQLVMIMLLCVFILGMTASFTGGEVHAEDKENNMSLYKASTSLRAYFSEATKPQEEGKGDVGVAGLTLCSGNVLNIGDAGAFVAYGEQDWVSSALSNSSSSVTYASLANVPCDPTNAGDKTSAILYYARYGYLLDSLGLDKTASGNSVSLGSLLSGVPVLALYYLAIAVPMFFNGLITILKTLNPFTLFGLATHTSMGSMNLAAVDASSPMYGLSMIVSAWYDVLYDFSWMIIVPIFFAVLVASMLLFRSTNKLAKIKKYIIRIAFIVIGIPLLGSLYTSMLSGVGDLTSTGNTAATRVVASTFCDFETWASGSRLAPPPGATLSYTEGDNGAGMRPTSDSLMHARETVFNINAATGSISDIKMGESPFAVSATTAEGIAGWDTTASGTDAKPEVTSSVSDVADLLSRYSMGDFYYGSDYETKIKAELTTASVNDRDTSAAIYKLFDEATKVEGWSGTYLKPAFREPTFTNSFNIFNNGSLNADDGVYKLDTENTYKNTSNVDSIEQRGLSTMSMYNYLNTSFNASNMVVYSSEKAASGFVRQDHKAVSLVGTGLVSFLYWLNCVLLLGSFAVIGYCYGFAIIFANLKRGIYLITSIPFAILGSMRAIAKVVIYTLMLICEVIVTIFIYGLLSEILMQLPLIVQTPLANSLNSSPIINNLATVLIPVVLIFSCIAYIIFTVQAVRFRKIIVKAVDEAAGDIINKFLDVNGSPVGEKPGLLQKAAGAAATGAGMAASQKLMGGHGKNSEEKRSGSQGVAGTAATGAGEADDTDAGDNGSTKGGNSGADVKKTAIGSDGDQKLLDDQKLLTTSKDGDGGDQPSGAVAGDDDDAGFGENTEQADRNLADQVSASDSIGAVPVVVADGTPTKGTPTKGTPTKGTPTKGTPTSSAKGTPTSSAKSIPTNSAKSIPTNSAKSIPTNSAKGTPTSSATGIPTSSATGVPTSSAKGTPKGTPKGTATSSATGTPTSSARVTPPSAPPSSAKGTPPSSARVTPPSAPPSSARVTPPRVTPIKDAPFSSFTKTPEKVFMPTDTTSTSNQVTDQLLTKPAKVLNRWEQQAHDLAITIRTGLTDDND